MVKIPTNLSNYNQIKITPVKVELNIVLDSDKKEYNLIINKNDIIKDSIQHFIKQNKLPYNYYSFIKSSVEEVIEAELTQKVTSTQESWLKNFENLNEEDIDSLISSTIVDFKNNLKLDNIPNKERFDIIYQTLITISSPQVFGKLLELDLLYINEVRKLDENWKNQYLLIAEDHEQELSNYKLQFNNDGNYQSLLSKHKQDIEMIQLSWMSDLNELKSKQIRENSELIKLLHDALTSKEDISTDFSSHLDIMKNLVETEFLTRPSCSPSLQNLFKEVAAPSPPTNKLGITVSEPVSGMSDPRIQDYINQLQSMGFTEQQAENALTMTGYDFEEAVDLLLESPEKVSQQTSSQNQSNPSSSPLLPSKFSLSKLASSSPPIFKNWGFKPFQSNSNESSPNPNNSNLQNNVASGASNKLRDWIGKTVSDIWTESNEARRGGNNIGNNQHHSLSESFTILLGNQIRIPFNLVLKVADLNDLVPPPSPEIEREMGVRTQTLASLYTSELKGLVVAVNPKQAHLYPRGTDVNRVLFDYCRHTTEFHFNDFNYQLKEIYENIISKTDNAGFKEGDYFITKHSNLPLYHTVFHLVIDF
ncbi:hypothetical protein CONCODRAFT_84873, partial [Conidiobolus coronatus NRRL 28638]